MVDVIFLCYDVRDGNEGLLQEEGQACDVVVAEDERADSGDPQPMTQFSCILYEHIKWDGYDCDVYYIANADGIHLDTILVNVNGGFNLAKTKVTFETLYTDGSKPEQSDNLYYTWSNGERMILCQSNADSTATITFMSADAISAYFSSSLITEAARLSILIPLIVSFSEA